MRIYLTAIAVALLCGCASVQKISPEEKKRRLAEHKITIFWSNPELEKGVDDGVIESDEYSYQYKILTAECTVQSKSISIPSPSCTQPPRQDCSGMTGFALGFCRSYTPKARCNYESVNAAYDAQHIVYQACMERNGWISDEVRAMDAAGIGWPSEEIGQDHIESVIRNGQNERLKYYLDTSSIFQPRYLTLAALADESLRVGGNTYASLDDRFSSVPDLMDVMINDALSILGYDQVQYDFVLLTLPEFYSLSVDSPEILKEAIKECEKHHREGQTLVEARNRAVEYVREKGEWP